MLIMIMTGMNDSSINDNVIRVMPFSKYIMIVSIIEILRSKWII